MSQAPDFSHFFYTAPDGLKLHARIYGGDNTGALPVVCLAGLTRNARDFHELALFLSKDAETRRKVIAFDYRGRGLSAYDPDWRNYDVPVEAADILAGLTALGIEHAAFIGASRGGLVILTLAAMRPGILKSVVLNDIGPVLGGAGLAQIRAYLERTPKPKSIVDAIAIEKMAKGEGFPALSDADWDRVTRAIYRDVDGVPEPDFDPALIKTLDAFDLSRPLPLLWPQFAGLAALPVMTIRGENSKLLSADTLAEMGRRHPRLETIIVSGQGHAPYPETAGLPEKIAAFIDQTNPRGG